MDRLEIKKEKADSVRFSGSGSFLCRRVDVLLISFANLNSPSSLSSFVAKEVVVLHVTLVVDGWEVAVLRSEKIK